MTFHVVVSYADVGTDTETNPCRTLHVKRTTTYLHPQNPNPRSRGDFPPRAALQLL
jgi:hypothetical protein